MAAEAGAGPADFVIPDALPVLPLRDAVVLPLTAVPLTVGRPRSVQLVDDVMRGNRLLALVASATSRVTPAPRTCTASGPWARSISSTGCLTAPSG